MSKDRNIERSEYNGKNVILVARSAGDPVPVTIPDDIISQLADPTQIKPTLGALTSLTEFSFEADMGSDDGPNVCTVTPATINTGNAVTLDDENDDEFIIAPGIYLILVAIKQNDSSAKTIELAVDGENGSASITQNSMSLPPGDNKVTIHRTLRFGVGYIVGTLGLTVYCADSEPGLIVSGEITFFKVG